MKRFLLLFLSCCWALFALAQPAAPPADLAGKDLRLWLFENWYKPYHDTLGYDGATGARGRMYNYIDNNPGQNKVVCVYAGYEVSWTYGGSGTNPQPINCEHTVPQSFFGYEEPMKSDIHHLFPTYGEWNSTRSNYPFAEIDDAQSQSWMYLDGAQTDIPTVSIEQYSEFSSTGSNRFEPREDHKGNVARAIFYFYTMYEGVAGIRPISDVGNLNTLYQWHLQDPVDAPELERNNRIETYQGNRNPYIDYPASLAKAWGFAPACESAPSLQVSALVLSAATHNSFKLQWTNGDRDARLVVVREAAAPTLTPAGTYTGISPDFSMAADQGSGNKVCFAGGGNTMSLSGLNPLTTYYVQVFEYCSATQQYLSAGAPLASITTTAAPVAPVGVGWQITATSQQYQIDFDQSVPGIGNGAFAAAGFTQEPLPGQLDSDSWAVGGFSDGDLDFGYEMVGGDLSMGSAAGAVSSGGLYAFEVSPGNIALGMQPTGDDFTPGSLTLRFQNSSEVPLREISLSYQLWVHNDQPRANALHFSHSADGLNFAEEASLSLQSPVAAEAAAAWTSHHRSIILSGLSIAPGAYYYLRWTGGDVSGSGARDEFALDNIALAFNGTPLCTAPATAASKLYFSDVTSSSMQLSWIRGGGTNCMVIAKAGAPVDAMPLNGTQYSASAVFGEGAELGQGNFVVYNGSASALALSNLQPGTVYHFSLVEWQCTEPKYAASLQTAGNQQTASLATLQYFRGSRSAGGVLLEWATSQESGLEGFILERSVDAVNYVQIASLSAQNTAVAGAQYQYTDSFEGTEVYYRLRFQSGDGALKLAEMLHLTPEVLGLQDPYQGQLVLLYPNPSSGSIKLLAQDGSSGPVSLQLSSLQGSTLLKARGSVAELEQVLSTRLLRLPAGSYLLLLQKQGVHQAVRLIRQ